MNNKIIIILLIISIGLNIGIITIFLFNNVFVSDNCYYNENSNKLRFNKQQHCIINEMKYEILDYNRENMEKIYYNRSILMQLIKQDKIDTVKINSIIDNITQLQAQIEKNTVLKIYELKKVLSKEQFNTLLEKMKQRGEKHKKSFFNRRTK